MEYACTVCSTVWLPYSLAIYKKNIQILEAVQRAAMHISFGSTEPRFGFVAAEISTSQLFFPYIS